MQVYVYADMVRQLITEDAQKQSLFSYILRRSELTKNQETGKVTTGKSKCRPNEVSLQGT